MLPLPGKLIVGDHKRSHASAKVLDDMIHLLG